MMTAVFKDELKFLKKALYLFVSSSQFSN